MLRARRNDQPPPSAYSVPQNHSRGSSSGSTSTPLSPNFSADAAVVCEGTNPVLPTSRLQPLNMSDPETPVESYDGSQKMLRSSEHETNDCTNEVIPARFSNPRTSRHAANALNQ